MNITLGTDMEFFVKKDGKIVPSQGIIPGTKQEPVQLTEHILMHRDNVLGEFTVKPATTPEEWVKNIKDAKKVVYEVCRDLNIEPVFMSHYNFDMADLLDPECLTFGCSPDYDATTNKANNPPDAWIIGGSRSAGGHIHIGYDNPTEEMNCRIVRFMDVLVGSLLRAKEGDLGNRRRELYGKAGCLRHKPYGVEYRTPGPEWFAAGAATHKSIFELAARAVEFAHKAPESYSYEMDGYYDIFSQYINQPASATKHSTNLKRREDWLNHTILRIAGA